MLELNYKTKGRNMQTIIYRNEDKVTTNEVLELFRKNLEQTNLFEKSEIEELSEIAAKNPVDKFIISEKPDVEVMQGDILIWSDITEEYKRNFPLVQNLKETKRMVLQDDDSLTGDHELVPLKGSKFTLQTGTFVPPIIKSAVWGSNSYDCKILEID